MILLQHTDDCRTAMQIANRSAEQHGSRHITWMDILIGIASAPGSASESLSACGVDFDELQRRALESKADDRIRGKEIVEIAIQEVERLNQNQLDVGHVLLAMVANRDGDCATMLQTMGVNVDELVEEIERRLPQPTFSLQQSLTAFADDSRVRELREWIDDAQRQIESHVRKADFETAAFYRDQKADVARKLATLLEQLWRDSKR